MKEVFNLIRYFSTIFLIVNFLLFLFRFKKETKAYKIFTIYLGIIVLIEITIRVVVLLGYENLIFSHVYFTGQFILLSLFFLELLNESNQRKIINYALIAVPIILLVNFILNPDQLHEFSLIEIILTSITLITYSTFHFYNMLSRKKEFYFINCGILIYLFGSTLTFLLRNLHVFYGRNFSFVLQMLNIVLYIVYLTLIFIEWKHRISKNSYERN